MSDFTKRINKYITLFKQAVKGEEHDYTSGSIDRAIFLLSIPMILEMAMESLFAVVDVYFVSRLGDTDAVATIGITESMMTILYSIAMGLSMGATATVARRVGEKNIESAKEAATQAIYIGVGFAVLLGSFGIYFAKDLLNLMGASGSLITHNVGYTRWMFGGNITIMMLFLINAIFRGAGDASIAMRSLWLANILNIILDPIFIFGLGPIPAFGVEGAAIATNIGRGLGVLFQLYFLLTGKSLIKIDFKKIKLQWDLIIKILKLSAGGAGQFLIGSASWVFLVRIMAEFGSSTLAGYTIAIRVIIFAILPAWGMANAAATLVGQNLGAGHPERAEKSVWRTAFINMVFLGLITILFFSFAGFILRFFTTDSEVLRNGTECLQIVSLGYIFYAYGMVINQSFNGAGDTVTPMVISVFGFWLFQIPFAYLLSFKTSIGPIGVYTAISVAESLMAIAGIMIFRRGRWKLIKV